MMIARLKSTLSRVPTGLWLVMGVSLLAAWPFVLRSSLTTVGDMRLHVFRTAELGLILRAGVPYARWAPDFYTGYGYPLYNYYAPLTYYVANLVAGLSPGAAVWGVRVTLVGTFLAGGVGMYGFARRWQGEAGGVTAAAAYVFAPYIRLIIPHILGHVAEIVALGLLPLALWAQAAYLDRQTRGRLVAASLGAGALLVAHNLQAPLGLTLIAGYTLWRAISARWSENDQPGAAWGLPLALAAGLGAFFWLPVILERDAVQLDNLIRLPTFDVGAHFLGFGELFGPALALDVGALNPEVRFNLGLAGWLLAAIGALMLIGAGREQRRRAIFWLAALVPLVVLMTPLSEFVWRALPPLEFVQFPWRLLGPSALCTAVLAGMSTRAAGRANASPGEGAQRWASRIIRALPLLMVLVGSLVIFAPPRWGDFGAVNRTAMLEFELQGRQLGTTATGDFLPAAVRDVPPPADSLIASYVAGGRIDKVDYLSLPEGAQAEVLRHTPRMDLFRIKSPEAFTLRVLTFDFAGWRAAVDGEPVPITPSEPHGLISLPMPEGEHTVRVWLGSTPARTLGWLVTALALATLALAAWRHPTGQGGETREQDPDVGMEMYAVVGVFVLLALGGLIGLWQPHSKGLRVEEADHLQHRYLAGGVDLLGYSLEEDKVEPGERLTVTLYWKAREPVAGDYQSFVHMVTTPLHTYAQSEALHPGGLPTSTWPADKYVRDVHEIDVPAGTAPGAYTLRVGLFRIETGQRQLVIEEDGTILGDAVALEVPVSVQAVDSIPDITSLPLDALREQRLTPGITLLGVDVSPEGTFDDAAGLLKLDVYLRAEASDLPDVALALRLVGDDGTVIASGVDEPVDGLHPASDWVRGEIVRSIHAFWINEDILPGVYSVEIGAVQPGADSPETWVPLAMINRTEGP